MARKNKEDDDEYRLPAKTTSRKRPKTWAEHRTTSMRKALLTIKKKKEEARPVLEDDDHINEQYYADFRQHVVDLRAHLAGKWTGTDDLEEDAEEQPMQVDDSDEEDDGQPYDPFTVTSWTEQEKDLFFHAVATHSRLRPDLIAASIKTKNMYDVCIYMRHLDDSLEQLKEEQLDSVLEAAATQSEHEGDGASVEGGSLPDEANKPRAFESDASKKARRDAKLEAAALQHRNAAPQAMEMSVPWVEFEERLAKLLCTLEDDDQRRGGEVALASAVARERVPVGSPLKDLPRKKQKLDKDGKGKGRAKEDQEEQEGPGSQRSSTVPPSPSDRASSANPTWKTANVYFLDGHLQVLENILRDAEDARAAADLAGQSSFIQDKMRHRSRSRSKSKSRITTPTPPAAADSATSVQDATSSENAEASTSDKSASVGNNETSSIGGRPISQAKDDSRHLDDVDEGDVDSYILPRRGEPSANHQRKSKPKGPASGDEDEEEKDIEGEQGQDAKEGKGEGSEQENEEERALKDPNLCPTVRRRFLNRIYMRKKRAMERGGLEAVEAVDTRSVRLKPGRKKKNAGSSLNSNSRAMSAKAGKKRKRSVEREDGSDEDDEGGNVDEERVDARDKKDRFWMDIEEAGIDEDVLTKEGMAYFNLSMLGKLLNYFTNGFRDRTIPGQAALSASLIRVMFTTVVEFLVDVIHRTVVLSESRSSVRTGSKVFRQNNGYVTVEEVKLALEIVGQPLEDRKTLLARLLHDKVAPPPPQGTIIQPTVPTSELAGMTFHRSLYLPFIQLPREYGGRDVGEEEDDHVEERGRGGYLTAMQRKAVGEESGGDEHEGREEDSISEGGEESERRDRLRRGKGKAADDIDVADEHREEDTELLALCKDPILPLDADDEEDEEYEKQMAEEEELDAKDTEAAKEFEQGVWDRTLEAGEIAVLRT